MNKKHSLVIEPDAAIAGREVEPSHQVRQIGKPDLIHFGLLLGYNREMTWR